METAAGTTNRIVWERLLSRYPQEQHPEHRREHGRRETTIGTVELSLDCETPQFAHIGKVLNMSATGLLLRLREEVEPRTPVLLRVTLTEGQATLLGRVVHCTPTVGAFKVGVFLSFDEQPR
jgi:hypothetical protein